MSKTSVWKTAGVTVERGHIKTDPVGGTGVPGIHAIGDVTGPPWLAHKASHEGVACVESIAGLVAHPPDRSRIPACTYCRPQIASVGLTEEQAIAAGRTVKVGRFPFVGNGKAIALGEAEGLIKTIFDNTTGELLGAHMMGAEVTELVQGFAIAMAMEATELDLMHTVFPASHFVRNDARIHVTGVRPCHSHLDAHYQARPRSTVAVRDMKGLAIAGWGKFADAPPYLGSCSRSQPPSDRV